MSTPARSPRIAHDARKPSARTRPSPVRALPPTPAPKGVHSSGRPLPADDRHVLERAYGWNLAAIRLHDSPAERGHAHALGARAFASGSHIVHAGTGAMPDRRVLAHEVVHVVQSALVPGGPSLQRYESPEHEDIGDSGLDDLLAFLQTPEGAEWARTRGLDAEAVARQIEADPLKKAGGKIAVGMRDVGEDGARERVSLTPGQIIALSGDFYSVPDAIAAAASKPLAKAGDKNEIDELQEAIEMERKGQLADANQTYDDLTGGRYLRLAKMNDEHFAPKNRTEWRRLHDQALAEAAAGAGPTSLNHALLLDAGGGHFLTDAYASGHLFRKNELLAAIRMHLATNPLRTENSEAQTYAAIVAWSGNDDQLVLKNIHDRMNHEGFDVTNARGMKWRTFGDALLAKAPETQRIAALAVFTSRQQVYAANRGEKPDPKEVEDLMPDDATLDRATLQAIAYIPAAAADVQGLMYRGRKLAGTQFPAPFGAIIESNLATIANPGRNRQLADMEEASRTTNLGPRLAPQFTIFDFP